MIIKNIGFVTQQRRRSRRIVDETSPNIHAPMVKNHTVQEACDAYREYLLLPADTPPLKKSKHGNIDTLWLFMCQRIFEIDEPYNT